MSASSGIRAGLVARMPALVAFIISLVLLPFAAPLYAASILASPTHASGNTWISEYTLINSSGGLDISEFTIYFDVDVYQGLLVVASPGGWDSIVIQPDPGIPAPGFFDSLALLSPLQPGESIGGFAVQFTYLGTGTPGPQPLDLLDADFGLIESGLTLVETPNSVPEPNVLLLLLVSLGAGGVANLARVWGSRLGTSGYERGAAV